MAIETEGTKQMKIWSRRFTIALGNHWKYERDCNEMNVQEWLKVFRDDEPNVIFIASKRKPAK